MAANHSLHILRRPEVAEMAAARLHADAGRFDDIDTFRLLLLGVQFEVEGDLFLASTAFRLADLSLSPVPKH